VTRHPGSARTGAQAIDPGHSPVAPISRATVAHGRCQTGLMARIDRLCTRARAARCALDHHILCEQVFEAGPAVGIALVGLLIARSYAARYSVQARNWLRITASDCRGSNR